MVLPEARLHIIILHICRLEALLQRHVPVVEDISVHNTHVVNTFLPPLPEVADQQVSLLF